MQKATFAGGCFWCMVSPFEEQPGIHGILSGYMGGTIVNPTYEQVKTGKTGHLEVVEITFDPAIFPYEKLLELYWPQIDPTDDEGQYIDRGSQYRTAIFYHNDDQHKLAVKSKEELEKSGRFDKPIVTEIKPAVVFFPAEEYHQNYHLKNPKQYKEERNTSGRDAFGAQYWK
ncbi:peptide-methionine (S)-S-oxide reductase [Paenibacillus sp. yr247]|uniref:peptide-methionine (S)-S-oxide reductase MsrA n=1 Tax=Paenibacillus sp. yr247 TaxID=1761880 RepID=UPI00088F54BE|nr:peptide-methionine (S)-S-oxide reductase MsrA [Paenibacillus sp. yr247]SDO75750.1 peptide-methionine (S)-S-oxide reductase [Paenibacillus sp. yr247]